MPSTCLRPFSELFFFRASTYLRLRSDAVHGFRHHLQVGAEHVVQSRRVRALRSGILRQRLLQFLRNYSGTSSFPTKVKMAALISHAHILYSGLYRCVVCFHHRLASPAHEWLVYLLCAWSAPRQHLWSHPTPPTHVTHSLPDTSKTPAPPQTAHISDTTSNSQ